MDFSNVFGLHVSPFELVVRGTLIYWFLFLLFRFLRRDSSGVGVADILLVVLVADASQNGMSGAYESVPEACILVTTLIGWNYLFDWAGFHFEWFRRFSQPPPLLLVHRGRVVRRNLRKEFVTREELEGELRKHGVTELAQVRAAYMESDGEFSVLTYEPSNPAPEKKRIPGA